MDFLEKILELHSSQSLCLILLSEVSCATESGQESAENHQIANNNSAKSQFKELLYSYSSNFSIHGLSKVCHGLLLERLIWGFCTMAIFSFILYMGYLYVARYLAKGVRTEFTYEEHQEMDLPPISFCLSRTFFSTSFCYKNQSYFREYPCNMTKIHTKMWLDADNRYEPVKDLGNNCHVFGLNKTYSVNPNKKQMVKLRGCVN